MGRLGNALRRGLTGNRKRNRSLIGRLTGGCLGTVLFLVVIAVCCIELFPSLLAEWLLDSHESASEAIRQGTGSEWQQAVSSMTVEEMVINDVELPPMSDDMKKNVLLQLVSVEDLVTGTISPFGEAGDGDERFRDITIKTEIIQTVRTHPSDDEVEAFRTAEHARMYEAKRQALIEAAEAEAEAAKKAPGQTGTPVPTEGAGKKKKKAAPTPTPAATPTPVPEPTWDGEDEAELEKRVARYIEDNTSTDEVRSFVSRTVEGEKVRAYLNSFHTPWQANYSEAAFIAMFDYGYKDDGTDASIEPEVVERVFRYGNMLEYHLYLDYWKEPDYWTGTQFLYDDRDTVFGGGKTAYEEYDHDYTEDPLKIDDRHDLLEEKGFIPLVLFDDISDWVIKTTYGNRLDGKNSYGLPVQTEKRIETSVSFNSFADGLELTDIDLDLFVHSFGLMPECTEQFNRLSSVRNIYSPAFYKSGVVISDFAWLTGGDLGSQAAYRALEIVSTNPVYSNSLRETSGYYDCSSFVARVYEELGIGSMRLGDWSMDTEALLHYFENNRLNVVTGGWPEDEGVLQPGDILLFAKAGKPKDRGVYHAAMWIGDGYIADASTSLGHVVYRPMWGRDEIIMIARPSLLLYQ